MSQLEITSCGEQIDISVFEDLSITIPDEFNGQSIAVPICQDSLVVSFFDPTPFPAFLFAAGEQGAWFDPSDLSTMFQDSAGTTPVTAVEQPVGRILDKSGRGNNATQATSASRPVLSARVNLLIRSEEFDVTATWTNSISGTGTNSVRTANAGVAPDGASTADRLQLTLNGGTTTGDATRVRQGITPPSAGTYIFSVWLKSYDGVSTYAMALQCGPTLQPITVTGAWQRFSVTATLAVASNANDIFIRGGQTPTHSDSVDILAWGADLRSTNQTTLLPAYQRVTTSTNYDTANFPLYLRFDGTDDSMATGTITPGIDKVQVFSGVRKLSDAVQGIVAELSVTATSNNGAFTLHSPRSGTIRYAMSSRGTSAVVHADTTSSAYNAPVTNVVTGLANISGDSIILRANSVQVTTNTSDQGTGNYLAYPLYIGSRAGSSSRFNGNLYSLIVRFGANLDATTISNTETWVNGKTMAY